MNNFKTLDVIYSALSAWTYDALGQTIRLQYTTSRYDSLVLY